MYEGQLTNSTSIQQMKFEFCFVFLSFICFLDSEREKMREGNIDMQGKY